MKGVVEHSVMQGLPGAANVKRRGVQWAYGSTRQLKTGCYKTPLERYANAEDSGGSGVTDFMISFKGVAKSAPAPQELYTNYIIED
jgi:hypothetical protein